MGNLSGEIPVGSRQDLEVKTRTIMDVAGEMYNNMEYVERENGDKYIKCINDVDWQRDIIREAHFNGERLPDDDVYERIYHILGVLMELDTEQDIDETIYGIEPDVYTFDLTTWLSKHNDNVYYLTEVLEEFGGDVKDGFQLLQYAQSKYIQEIGSSLLSGIEEYIESEE